MKKIKTLGHLLLSKGIAICSLAILIFKYSGLADQPFAELFYAVILVGTVIVCSPVIRLLVFAEAAELAESGKVRDLLRKDKVCPALHHYWFATSISYAVTLLCVSSLL
tara:strand:+ start:835 stop:1161 length:327 start_codon:yes stop_codon:yes gene_type:complete